MANTLYYSIGSWSYYSMDKQWAYLPHLWIMLPNYMYSVQEATPSIVTSLWASTLIHFEV